MKKRVISILLAIMLLVTSVSAVQISSYAASKLVITGSKTVYTLCTTTLKVKNGTKAVAASKCTFTSSNKAVATVSAAGVVTGVKAGTVTITAKLKSNAKIKGTYKITVKTNTITSPVYTLNFAKGSSNTLVIYVSKKRAGSGTVSFASSNTKVATVDKNGKVTAKGKGSAYITVKVKKTPSIYRKIKINVTDGKSFSITPSSTPLNGTFLNFGSYNATNKIYYTIRSYLEYFESHPGCTLTFTKGTYALCTALYIPSNTKIVLNDGVTITKATSTGTTSLPLSNSLFMFCDPSKSSKEGAYSKYDGVHDSAVIGKGNATIDLAKGAAGKLVTAFVMGHNQNITIDGVNFKNCAYGHFIEMDASKNVLINNCTFKNQIQPKDNSAGECINLDTPDKVTGGFSQKWTSYDCTPNMDVTISGCTFSDVQRAVGTHQYTQDKYHTNITVDNCSFQNCKYGAIVAMNWANTTITNNSFNGVGYNQKGELVNPNYYTSCRAISFFGCIDGIFVDNNIFQNCYQIGAVNFHSANGYDTTYCQFSQEALEYLARHNYYLGEMERPFVAAYQNWDGCEAPYSTYYLIDYELKDELEQEEEQEEQEENEKEQIGDINEEE